MDSNLNNMNNQKTETEIIQEKTGLDHVLVDCTDTADLVVDRNGNFFWHEYDPQVNPQDGRFSINYKSESEAWNVWKNNSVTWQ